MKKSKDISRLSCGPEPRSRGPTWWEGARGLGRQVTWHKCAWVREGRNSVPVGWKTGNVQSGLSLFTLFYVRLWPLRLSTIPPSYQEGVISLAWGVS